MTKKATSAVRILAAVCATVPAWAQSPDELVEPPAGEAVVPPPVEAVAPPEVAPVVAPVPPPEPPNDLEPRQIELERRVEILTEEVQRLREQIVLPETEELRSRFGLGPAASRVYGVARGLSIGGYGELHFQGVVNDRTEGEANRFDIPRVVLYAGYKFTPRILVNVELEFEHAEVAEVEFATLDFLLHDAVNLRAGLVLLPVGLINEYHEPPFFHGNLRPLVERRIIPTTWRELGAGVLGEPVPGLEYRLYLVTGMRATSFGPGGWAAGRQHGRRAIGEDVAVAGRVDYEIVPQLHVGASVYHGGADQGEIAGANGEEIQVDTTLLEAHAQLRWRGLEVRALGVWGRVKNAGHVALAVDPDGTAAIGSQVGGAYADVSFDVMSLVAPDARWSIEPWVRVEWADTQVAVPDVRDRPEDGAQSVTAVSAGVAVKPITNVVVKAEYVDQRNAARTRVSDSIFLGGGFVF